MAHKKDSWEVSLTKSQLDDLINCVDFTMQQVGERYAWPGDLELIRGRSRLQRLLKKLKGYTT